MGIADGNCRLGDSWLVVEQSRVVGVESRAVNKVVVESKVVVEWGKLIVKSRVIVVGSRVVAGESRVVAVGMVVGKCRVLVAESRVVVVGDRIAVGRIVVGDTTAEQVVVQHHSPVSLMYSNRGPKSYLDQVAKKTGLHLCVTVSHELNQFVNFVSSTNC